MRRVLPLLARAVVDDEDRVDPVAGSSGVAQTLSDVAGRGQALDRVAQRIQIRVTRARPPSVCPSG